MRHPDWQNRLLQAVEEARPLPHRWGQNDCGLFALMRCFEAVTGERSPIADLAGTYFDEDTAQTLLRELGVEDVEGLAALHLPRHEGPQLARRGDIGVVQWTGGKTLVVVLGPVCAAPGDVCLSFLKRSHLIASFMVG